MKPKPEPTRPSLAVITTYFHESDRAAAKNLGDDLFDLLTRPVSQPLEFGAGIPVFSAMDANAITLDIAKIVVVIPVLGATSFFLDRRKIVGKLNAWHRELGDGRVLIVPVVSQWRAVESNLPSKQFLTELYGEEDRRRHTLEEIVLALTRVLQQSDPDQDEQFTSPHLFISHAKLDLQYNDVAKVLHEYVTGSTTGRAFFDANSLVPGKSLVEQLDDAAKQGVLVAIRGDAYSSRSWCQREMLVAKQHSVPTLVVEMLREGESRSSPYGGNTPTIVWSSTEAPKVQAARIILKAMVEWLRTTYYRREGERIKIAAALPADATILPRAPELLDLANGRIPQRGCVLYPDPELPVIERQILQTAYPRLIALTPTTAYRHSLGATADAPLEGKQISVSVSESLDVNGPEGFTKNHLDDVFIYIVRTLVSSGAGIAYGGDFRKGGYTEQLSELIATYNETASEAAEFLHLYQDATVDIEKASSDRIKAEVHHLSRSDDALVPFSDKDYHPKSIYQSDMLRVMTLKTAARVVIGGKTSPRLYEQDTNGYSGIYPGVVEEAWWTLRENKPLYVIGGFGGAAGAVADLLLGKRVPCLESKNWKSSKVLGQVIKVAHSDPKFKELNLPKSMDDIAEKIQKLGQKVLRSDKSAMDWNGLTRQQNLELLCSRDPLHIATLVLNGLMTKTRVGAHGKLKIELVNGSVTRAERLNAIAVAAFDNIPLGGAGAALDRACDRRASAAHAQGEELVKLNAFGVDADWLYLASLGPVDKLSQASLLRRVRAASQATRDAALRHRFWRLGVVTFGGAVAKDFRRMAQTMLDELLQLDDDFSITWFETDKDQFRILHELLRSNPDVALTTKRVQVDAAVTTKQDESVLIQLQLDREKLSVTKLPPSGTAIVSAHTVDLKKAIVDEFSQGEGSRNRNTPANLTLMQRGAKLTKLVLGDDAETFLANCNDKRIVIVHDIAASRLPFEMMTVGGKPLVTRFGLNRRLVVPNASPREQFARPPKSGQLNLLLVVNPTGDLPGTEVEAKQVESILKPFSKDIKITKLAGNKVTKAALQNHLAWADVLHYCGHAFFDGPGEQSSGLLVAGGDKFTLADLRSVGILPRMAFVNACEAGRVRGAAEDVAPSAAFAEFFLRSGIEAYIGTYWQVSDASAAKFATNIYSGLAGGITLDAAIKQGRTRLFEAGDNEWANYIFYGNGLFRLRLSQQ